MNNKSSQPEQQISKVKSPAFIGSLICFIGYIVIIGLGYAEKLSEKWIGWIDIACLVLGLITYIADTSGFLDKKTNVVACGQNDNTCDYFFVTINSYLYSNKHARPFSVICFTRLCTYCRRRSLGYKSRL
ncbi:hypothetical protein [Klebsiella quasipneumoniae]|uniref:hypothetical protein n=1 Tax=Klebsiella quasipneumoniae TaxID=1463165 RepID=UPI0039B5BC62